MRRLLAVLLPLTLLAACGDDDDEAGVPTTAVVDEDVTEPSTEAGDDSPTTDAAGEDDAAPDSTGTTVPTDGPAGDAPGEGSADDEGLGDALLVSDLSGDAEVPGPGDAGAQGRFEAELHEGVLCVDMAASGLSAPVTGAHLHDGSAGAAGPVIFDIGDPSSPDGDPVRWDDACTEVGDDVIARLADAPETVYVNVHTSSHPDGAIRGQLSVASVFDRTLDR